MLLEHGCNPHRTGFDGFNPLHRAIWGDTPQHTRTAEVFLEWGLSPTEPAYVTKFGAQTEAGYVTPMQMVENEGTRELLDIWARKEAMDLEKRKKVDEKKHDENQY